MCDHGSSDVMLHALGHRGLNIYSKKAVLVSSRLFLSD